jgi:hypothetical protein
MFDWIGDGVMNQKFTRRIFLELSLKGSLMTGGCTFTTLLSGAPISLTPEEGSTKPGFDRNQEDALRAAMDVIIPAEEGMPSASAVGGIRYLERLVNSNPAIKGKLERSFKALDEISLKSFKSEFSSLPQDQKTEALKRLEGQLPPQLFLDLRDYIYESYYTQPQVWKLIGYEFYPSNHQGPHMNPFDEAVLSQVKKMGKLYREVS